MLSIREIKQNEVEICINLDKKTINLWNRKQWLDEFKKNGARVIVLSLSTKVIGISVFQIVIDEAQHYFSIHPEFAEMGMEPI